MKVKVNMHNRLSETEFQKIEASFDIYCTDCKNKIDISHEGLNQCDKCESGSNWDE